jgi:hypothetical protein
MSGHTSALSLESITDTPICCHYNSIRPCPEAATASPVDTLVHLAGISHSSSPKARWFRVIDLASIRLARWPYPHYVLEALRQRGNGHADWVW